MGFTLGCDGIHTAKRLRSTAQGLPSLGEATLGPRIPETNPDGLAHYPPGP
jgi:hypothetical protein